MKTVIAISTTAALMFAGSVMGQAGTCEDPIPLTPGTWADNTADYANTISVFGPLASPHNDIVYSFVAEGADATFTMESADFDYGIVLLPGCAGISPPPLNATTGPAEGNSFQLAGLTDGQTYYVVVTGNPSVDQVQNGSFTMVVTPTLPVELQSFSVD